MQPVMKRILASALLFGVVACAQTPPPPARTPPPPPPPSVEDVRAKVMDMAFDTSKYFAKKSDREIHIRYLGEGTSPAWAMAIIRDCVGGDPNTLSSRCKWVWRARMVNTPAQHKGELPRMRASRFIGRMKTALDQAPGTPISALIKREAPKWVETDSRACPNLTKGIQYAKSLVWTPAEFHIGPDMAMRTGVSHGDIAELTFAGEIHKASYRGWTAGITPSAWAATLAQAFDPCWRDATAPAPWSAY